jgi:hypothetical protein
MSQGQPQTRALLVFNPPESKRLIAKGVAALPQLAWARQHGRIVVGNGTTNAFIVEELTGQRIDKVAYAAGVVWRGELGVAPGQNRIAPLVLIKGERVERPYVEVVREFEAGDVFIKGANAVDPQGRAGILIGSDIGGTIGSVIGPLVMRGSHLIIAVGLEKLVPSVLAAARECGAQRIARAHGIACGMMPVVNATVVTELEALRALASVDATHVASGGIEGSEGAVVVAVSGAESAVAHAVEIADSVKGEPPVRSQTVGTI